MVNPNPHKTVVIPYVSAYGYTKSLAEKIADGIRASGEIDVRAYDMVEADPSKVLEELGFADGILLGSPTILGEALKPIWDLTTSILRAPTAEAGKCFRKLRVERGGSTASVGAAPSAKYESRRRI